MRRSSPLDFPDVPGTVIVGAQWGDEGKGKIVDLLAQNSDVVCRYQGGPNAGHTIVVGDETYKIRALPERRRPRQAVRHRQRLRRRPRGADRRARRSARGPTASVVPLRQRAHDHAVAPRDRPGERAPPRQARDRDDEARHRARATPTRRCGSGSASRTSSTRRSSARRSRSRSRRRTSGSSASTRRSRSTSRRSRRSTRATRSGSAPYVARHVPLRRDARCATARTCSSRARRRRCSTSTTARIRSSRRRTRSRRARRPASGSGRSASTACIGVSKAYVTRVGEGPFPSEIAGDDQTRMRELGGEYGTVTGRERRCGWLDLVALRYAVRVNGIDELALTKLDVLSHFAELPVCVRYRHADGSETRDFPAHQSDFHAARARLRDAARLERAARRLQLGRRPPGGGARLRRVRRAGARRRGEPRRHRRRARVRAQPRLAAQRAPSA